MKRYYNMLLGAVFLMIKLPVNAQQEKVSASIAQKQKRGPAIDTAAWQAFDLGAV